MAINKNHEFEELDGIKCSIVEKNASAQRVQFLKDLLTFNKYQVVVAASPLPKAAPAAAAVVEGETASTPIPEPVAPTTFTVGVTDLRFNPTNAIFGRSLHTPDGHIVTLAFWQEKEAVSNDELPYYEHK
jgi:hypothetical protein